MTSSPVPPIADTLELVGPRLRKIREQRGVTLTDVADRTGISKSTLSRLENGQRRPSLELLLPLAQLYRVPLDDLVGAPEVGDPRIRLKPRKVNGRTVVPLTHPGGIQAWKILIPKGQSEPRLRTHDGYEWLYVLSGRMRLIQGDRDLVLETGEAAEFDTRLPHWFGSTGGGPAEVLSIFGRPGEQLQLRAALAQADRGPDEPDGH
ncbi:XRE family transcriptional regulator [Nocardioides bigeumensis]|uniref:helix-turn-helix domain-containing protein n=1 Tax=Nocardioides bigeumensis TaxID=433657 RepID=UPI0031DE0F1C